MKTPESEHQKRGRPPHEGETATGQIQSRTTMARKNAYVKKAQSEGKSLTKWMFDTCDKEAGYKS